MASTPAGLGGEGVEDGLVQTLGNPEMGAAAQATQSLLQTSRGTGSGGWGKGQAHPSEKGVRNSAAMANSTTPLQKQAHDSPGTPFRVHSANTRKHARAHARPLRARATWQPRPAAEAPPPSLPTPPSTPISSQGPPPVQTKRSWAPQVTPLGTSRTTGQP